ncbi:MAG: sortase B protein-sorting domain-containing protein [Oscillospiraceae bacterium]|nr:sortase B protein-sorting domain-containing protein [Oscillospiraceae bacterium]
MNAGRKITSPGGKFKNFFLGVLCLIFMTGLYMPAAHAADSAELNLKISQIFTTTETSAPPDNNFNYILTPKAAANPMPACGNENGYNFSIEGTQDINIGPIIFTQTGIYIYELKHITAPQPKYVYDQEVYTLEIYIDNNMTAIVVVYKENGNKAMEIKYNQFYAQAFIPSDPELMTDPPVVKTVSGNPATSEVFTFLLKAQYPSQPMPAGSVNGVKTVQITGSGRAEFGTWSYTSAGTYYYYVSEVNTGVSGYDYDTAVYTITDSVKNIDGRLTVTRIVTNNANRQVTSMSFINVYTLTNGGYVPTAERSTEKSTVKPVEKNPDITETTIPEGIQPPNYTESTAPNFTINPETENPTPNEPTISHPEIMQTQNPADKFVNPSESVNRPTGYTGKEVPKTGDESQIKLYTVLFLISSVTAVGSIGYLMAGKKRRKAKK